MKKLIGRGEKGVSVEVLRENFKVVARRAIMYGMEVYWDGQEGMKKRLQIWVNRCISGILGAVRTMLVDVMVGEVGMKRVEYELDKTVEKWGLRVVRRGFGDRFGDSWKEEMEEVGSWRLGWEERVIREALRNKYERESWDFGIERGGNMGWKVVIRRWRKEAKREWEEGVE